MSDDGATRSGPDSEGRGVLGLWWNGHADDDSLHDEEKVVIRPSMFGRLLLWLNPTRRQLVRAFNAAPIEGDDQ